MEAEGWSEPEERVGITQDRKMQREGLRKGDGTILYFETKYNGTGKSTIRDRLGGAAGVNRTGGRRDSRPDLTAASLR